MRGTTRTLRRFATAFLAAGVVLWAGCGSRHASGQQDASTDDSAVVVDGSSDAAGDDASQDAGPTVVEAWIARDFMAAFGEGAPVPNVLEDILRRNAAGEPAGSQLIWLLRVEPTSATEARLSWGLGEIVDAASNLYRFLPSRPPVVVTGANWGEPTDAGPPLPHYFSTAVAAPFEMPVAPTAGTHPASVLSVLPGYDVLVQWGPTSVWPEFSIEKAYISQEAACSVWINNVNLLDFLDDYPTESIGSATGSVDYQTCACQCAFGETFFFSLEIVTFYPVNLLVEQ